MYLNDSFMYLMTDYYACKQELIMKTFFLQVSPSGEISNIDQFRSFPDYPETAKVFGGKSGMIPEKVTT